MKTIEEIQQIALGLYPIPVQLNSLAFDIHNAAVKEKERNAFIKGYELAQAHYEQKLLLIEMGKEHDKKC